MKRRWAGSNIEFLTNGASLKWEILALKFMRKHRKGLYCWEWKGAKNGGGYGIITVEGKNYMAHRVSYELYNGPILKGYKNLICHTCDNPGCVNPGHLYLGTHKDNSEDMISRRRHHVHKQQDKELRDFLDFALNLKEAK